MPGPIQQAGQQFEQLRARAVHTATTLAGSRWLTAILAAFALAFGAHAVYAPDRLPTVGGLSMVQSGLPPSLDFEYAEQARRAREAVQEADLRGRASGWVAANPDKIWLVNAGGFGGALLLLAGNLWLIVKRRRFTAG